MLDDHFHRYFCGHSRTGTRKVQSAVERDSIEDFDSGASPITKPSMMSKLSSSASRAVTSGRYQPRAEGGRRTRRRASRAPPRSRVRPMVRRQGAGRDLRLRGLVDAETQHPFLQSTPGTGRLVGNRWLIRALHTIQALLACTLNPAMNGGHTHAEAPSHVAQRNSPTDGAHHGLPPVRQPAS
jgi:hypothetical protein